MKIIKFIILFCLVLFCINVKSQVKIDFNSESIISAKGRFEKVYKSVVDFELPAKDIKGLLETEKSELAKSDETKPFQLAVPVNVDLDVSKSIQWTDDEDYSFGKFTIKVNGALSASINFDQFFLPKGTEMYVYNEDGNMITGPITESENSESQIWGSWVYRGQFITVEVKTPFKTKNSLVLHANNIAYGYKDVYKSIKAVGFGGSGICNINVICPLGNGWEGERNSVALILSDNGTRWCSGSMIMNTCSTNRPFFLTANHCFNPPGLPQQNITAWRFTFQYFSTTCPNPGVDVPGITFNGSTLRANFANSDFCLVELTSTPPVNSGINYAGCEAFPFFGHS